MTTIKSLCRPVFRIAVLAAALAALLCIAGIGASEAFAATVTTDDGFTIDRSYSYGSYTVSVKSYSGKGGDITLPEKAEINGTEYTITTIGGAFKNKLARFRQRYNCGRAGRLRRLQAQASLLGKQARRYAEGRS